MLEINRGCPYFASAFHVSLLCPCPSRNVNLPLDFRRVLCCRRVGDRIHRQHNRGYLIALRELLVYLHLDVTLLPSYLLSRFDGYTEHTIDYPSNQAILLRGLPVRSHLPIPHWHPVHSASRHSKPEPPQTCPWPPGCTNVTGEFLSILCWCRLWSCQVTGSRNGQKGDSRHCSRIREQISVVSNLDGYVPLWNLLTLNIPESRVERELRAQKMHEERLAL